MIDIIIPIYKPMPTADDCMAIKQAFRILKDYAITFVHPKSLDTAAYRNFGKAEFKSFDDRFFKGIYGYNCLMLSTDFYESFHQKYILIYQTDAYIFKDNLKEWCNKDYDYVGAPWLRSGNSLPLIKKLWDYTACLFAQCLNYHGNGKTQKNKSLIYNTVGNGGFSLRKRKKCIEVLTTLSQQVKAYLNPKNKNVFFAEDVFFSVEPKRWGLDMNIPNYKEACAFAIENKPERALAINSGELPMGCHRWNKETREFWKPYMNDDEQETI